MSLEKNDKYTIWKADAFQRHFIDVSRAGLGYDGAGHIISTNDFGVGADAQEAARQKLKIASATGSVPAMTVRGTELSRPFGQPADLRIAGTAPRLEEAQRPTKDETGGSGFINKAVTAATGGWARFFNNSKPSATTLTSASTEKPTLGKSTKR